MSAVSTIPLTIEPEAAARVAELGLGAELEQMLDRARQVIPSVRRIEVRLWVPEDFDDDPRVTLETICAADEAEQRRIDEEWCDWTIRHVSPDVWRHFTFFVIGEVANAG